MRHLLQFLRATHAGATALTAAAVSVMTVMGAALITDHLWFVDKRDLLKAAADAATVAATIQLRNMSLGMSDASVKASLQTTAERYVWLNLKSNLNDDTLKQSDVKTTLDVNRTTGIVDVTVDAPIGTSLLSRVVGYHGPDSIGVGGATASSSKYAFINTKDVQAMYDTFDRIAGQLRPLRRTY